MARSEFQRSITSERAFLLAGVMAITGLGLAIGGASSAVVVALISVSASIFLGGLAVQILQSSQEGEAGTKPKEGLLAFPRLARALRRLVSRVLSSRGGLALVALVIVSVGAVASEGPSSCGLDRIQIRDWRSSRQAAD